MDTIKFVAGITAVLVGFIVISFLIIGVIVQVGRPFSVNQCAQFSQQSGYETKFVDYNPMSYDCLAKGNNNKWISTSMLREVN